MNLQQSLLLIATFGVSSVAFAQMEGYMGECLDKPVEDAILLKMQKEKYRECVPIIDSTLSHHPKCPHLYYYRGMAYHMQGAEKNALIDYEKALELDPEHFEARYHIGAVHYNRGASLVPKDTPPDTQVDLTADAKAHYQKAIPILERCREMQPEHEYVVTALKLMYTHLGEKEKAAKRNAELEKILATPISLTPR